MMYNSDDDDVRSKSDVCYFLLTVITVLSFISNGSAYNDNRWNEIARVANVSQSDFDKIAGGIDEGPLNDGKIGIFLFTQYCGPGERVWKARSGPGKVPSKAATYADIDVCCKQHDECPNYISSDGDYSRYPGLPRKSQIFSRLECTCDGQFFKCLSNLSSQYASTVAFGYGVVQSQCFELSYPIVGCNKYSTDLIPSRRCLEYRVDNTKGKTWQWFDVPPASSNLYDIPKTTT